MSNEPIECDSCGERVMPIDGACPICGERASTPIRRRIRPARTTFTTDATTGSDDLDATNYFVNAGCSNLTVNYDHDTGTLTIDRYDD